MGKSLCTTIVGFCLGSIIVQGIIHSNYLIIGYAAVAFLAYITRLIITEAH